MPGHRSPVPSARLLLCALCASVVSLLVIACATNQTRPALAATELGVALVDDLTGCAEIAIRTFEVQRVIDGDTSVVMYDGELTSCRLYGVDAPELRDQRGPDVRELLRSQIEAHGGTVTIDFPGRRKRDNFGRLLIRAEIGGIDLADWLVGRGLAREVTGDR